MEPCDTPGEEEKNGLCNHQKKHGMAKLVGGDTYDE